MTKGRAKRRRKVVVGVLAKALRIVDLVQASPSRLNLKKISERTGINTSTAYRILAHLERERYLARDQAGTYTLGMKLLLIGARARRGMGLRETAGPILRELALATEETVNLAVLDQGTVLYLDVVESHHAFRLVSSVVTLKFALPM